MYKPLATLNYSTVISWHARWHSFVTPNVNDRIQISESLNNWQLMKWRSSFIPFYSAFLLVFVQKVSGEKYKEKKQQQLGNILSLPRFMKYVANIFFLFKSEQMLAPQTSQCLSLITDWKQLFLKEKHFSSF